MSFFHTHSSECLKIELDLFSLPSTQTSIENSQWIYYKSVTSLANDVPLKFVVPGHDEDYLDLTHTMLSLRVHVESFLLVGIVSSSGIKVGPINHFVWKKKTI